MHQSFKIVSGFLALTFSVYAHGQTPLLDLINRQEFAPQVIHLTRWGIVRGESRFSPFSSEQSAPPMRRIRDRKPWTLYSAGMAEQMQKILMTHYNQYKDQEYFSGAALSIYIPNDNIRNYYVGRVSHSPKSKLMSGDTLFQIGSITKSFTAAIILQLEKEGKLRLGEH